ncbi:ribosome silencing factor [Lactococcus cremoris]|uniref:Ribosomal silencing factor RsfS n=1 Tax=Lactococcus lactis subsp. cremoris (strain MG1363) TaxID=416870 RepID=A2RHV8_LACLM|nr:ribosome silencing factor [Lactococcus cremoris]ADJ59263.1 iojap-like protein [Lactococcus cremoris subsp. cremoris NZ9000]KZK53221.1 Ribosomal silencing factor RsfA (former Iojap) [Lactococcus cremoris]MCT4434950.1 ribosome silencing factor [Lactococcus cremoris]MCT4445667.1 ribosome silencing factor [Lactococcus cremoris]MCZ7688006.1 ribosome silencing factor [Lactococcus cremoris]
MDSKKLLEVVVKAADDKKALDIVALDMSDVTFVADYFVIMEAMNSRQLDAIADNIAEAAELAGAKAAGHIEGDAKTGWVLIDLGDIVVSVFGYDERGHFNLEKLWSDAPMVDISGFIAE